MRSESSNYMLGPLDKILVLKFVLKPVNPDTKFKMARGWTIKNLAKALVPTQFQTQRRGRAHFTESTFVWFFMLMTTHQPDQPDIWTDQS